MKPAAWYWNAVRRTLLTCFPVLARPDDDFAARHLEPLEQVLYRRMSRVDRHHACLVAKKLLARCPQASAPLVRAALLHDVGKAGYPLTVFTRIIVHLYTPPRLPAEPRMRGLRGAWQLKLHHGRYGAQMIRAAGGSEAVARLVARHDRPAGDPLAALLKQVDEQT